MDYVSYLLDNSGTAGLVNFYEKGGMYFVETEALCEFGGKEDALEVYTQVKEGLQP